GSGSRQGLPSRGPSPVPARKHPMPPLRPAAPLLLLAAWLFPAALGAAPAGAAAAEPVYPGADWDTRTPEQAGLAADKLKALAALAGGRGCVGRHGSLLYPGGAPAKSGDVASAVKPVLSTLLLLAVQQDKLKSVDARVADFEPRLRDLNRGKDAA